MSDGGERVVLVAVVVAAVGVTVLDVRAQTGEALEDKVLGAH